MATPQVNLRLVSNTQIELDEKVKRDAASAIEEEEDTSRLATHLNKMWNDYRWHNQKIHDRCIAALRAYKAIYSPSKWADIKKFGGSEVFSGITSVKCRSATALLRDVFLGINKPWGVRATPVPDIPNDSMANINELVIREALSLQQEGVSTTAIEIERRRNKLMLAAQKAIKKDAAGEAEKAEDKLDDILTEGKFYSALIEFLTDLPIFPYAVIKGPVIQNSTELKWVEGKLKLVTVPRMFWYRVSPLDIYFAPGSSNVDDAGIIEHIKISRTDLQNLRTLPGTYSKGYP